MKRPEYYEENGCLHVQFGEGSAAEQGEDMLFTDFMQQWLRMMKKSGTRQHVGQLLVYVS